MNSEELLKEISEFKPIRGHNIMGASENWYCPVFAIKQTFTEDEIKSFSEETIDALIRLGEKLSEAFY